MWRSQGESNPCFSLREQLWLLTAWRESYGSLYPQVTRSDHDVATRFERVPPPMEGTGSMPLIAEYVFRSDG